MNPFAFRCLFVKRDSLGFRSHVSKLHCGLALESTWIHDGTSAGRAWRLSGRWFPTISKVFDPTLCGPDLGRTCDLAHGSSNKSAICLRISAASTDRAVDSDELTLSIELEARAPIFFISALADMPKLPARGWACSSCHEKRSWTRNELQTYATLSNSASLRYMKLSIGRTRQSNVIILLWGTHSNATSRRQSSAGCGQCDPIAKATFKVSCGYLYS